MYDADDKLVSVHATLRYLEHVLEVAVTYDERADREVLAQACQDLGVTPGQVRGAMLCSGTRLAIATGAAAYRRADCIMILGELRHKGRGVVTVYRKDWARVIPEHRRPLQMIARRRRQAAFDQGGDILVPTVSPDALPAFTDVLCGAAGRETAEGTE